MNQMAEENCFLCKSIGKLVKQSTLNVNGAVRKHKQWLEISRIFCALVHKLDVHDCHDKSVEKLSGMLQYALQKLKKMENIPQKLIAYKGMVSL